MNADDSTTIGTSCAALLISHAGSWAETLQGAAWCGLLVLSLLIFSEHHL